MSNAEYASKPLKLEDNWQLFTNCFKFHADKFETCSKTQSKITSDEHKKYWYFEQENNLSSEPSAPSLK